MKKNFLSIVINIIIVLICLVSCDNNVYDYEAKYNLEDNEEYSPYKIKSSSLSSLDKSNMSIEGISENLFVDPYRTTLFSNEILLRYPTSSLLQGKCILYTSSWYERNTFSRADDVFEYSLVKKDGLWYVENISNTASTFIPFNGVVLSIPKSINITFSVGQQINIINDSIDSYDIGFYNQNGKRIVVKTANQVGFNNNGINLYDSHDIGDATEVFWEKVSIMNCLYDEKSFSYFVDKFRKPEVIGTRVFANVNNGFSLVGTLNNSNENLSIIEGVRFNKNDIINVENTPAINKHQYTFSLTNNNTIIYDSGETRTFSIKKSTSNYTESVWGWEVAVSKNNRIVEVGTHVTIPTDGYKFVIKGENGDSAEKINSIFESYFTIGDYVELSENKIVIDGSPISRILFYNRFINEKIDELLAAIKTKNYSYDENTLISLKERLEEILVESNSIIENNNNANLQYRLYQLIGELKKINFSVLSATNRNEAVQVKSVWYVNDYNSYDKTLDGLISNLKKIKESGINEIIVEVYENGYVNYPDSKTLKFNPKLSNSTYGEYGNNFLKAICSEAHKINLKVFATYTPFSKHIINSIPSLDSAWAYSIDGNKTVVSANGIEQMMDPSNPLFIEKNKEIVDDILYNNPYLDGFHLDGIRFGADNNYIDTVLGITESAMNGFNLWCDDNGLDYSFNSMETFKNNLKSNKSIFDSFNKYQQDLITNTVSYIKDICKKYDVPLTAAVADNYNLVKQWKCQDWGKWAKLGIIDALYLMDYYFDEYYVDYFFKDMYQATNNQTMLVTGINPSYANLVDEYYARTIKGAVTHYASSGYAIFGSHTQNAKKDGWNLISQSNWIDSLSPYDSLSKTMKACGELLLNRCDDIYIKYNNQTVNQKQLLSNDLDALYQLLGDENYQNCLKLIEKIETMISIDYAYNEANNRIDEQLQNMLKIAKMKANILK